MVSGDGIPGRIDWGGAVSDSARTGPSRAPIESSDLSDLATDIVL